MIASMIDVWTVSVRSFFLFAPKYLETRTLVPIDMPIEMLMMKFSIDAVDPTAAMELREPKRPTTIVSAALNVSCRRLVSTSGIENRRILGNRGPSTMSIE